MASISQKPKKTRLRNVMGLEIRRFREEKCWSQADLARQLQLAGWDIERSVLTKIELRKRCLTDYELMMIAQTLGVTLNALIPVTVDLNKYF